MRPRAVVLAAVIAPGLTGCVGTGRVERAYGGDVVWGRAIEPEAYAAVLRGAMAEAGGHLADALREYGEAARRDGRSPEVWARIGAVRCQADPKDARARQAFDRALRLDSGYARAWAARARCETSRGETEAAQADAARAAALDPTADGADVLLARSSAAPGDAATRERLVALTATARDPVVAWDALAAWAQARGDVALWAMALERLARIAPERRMAIARDAEDLAGAGELGAARRVAAAAVDATDEPLPADRALAARLAVDEAIVRGDGDLLRVRATRARVSLDEAAGRALLAGRRDMAQAIAQDLAGADPQDAGARLVLVALGAAPASAAAVRPGDAPVAAGTLVACGVALARLAPARAGAELAGVALEPLVGGDDSVERAAVELVSRGVLPASVLPPDGLVELAAVRGDARAALPGAGLDARHEYLALALRGTDSARARELAVRLAAVEGRDPVVAAAAALMRLATHAPVAPGAPQALLARNPSDPLLAATALRVAQRVGDAEVARRARETLTALGGKSGARVE